MECVANAFPCGLLQRTLLKVASWTNSEHMQLQAWHPTMHFFTYHIPFNFDERNDTDLGKSCQRGGTPGVLH